MAPNLGKIAFFQVFPDHYILVVQLFDAIGPEYQRRFKINYEPDSFQIWDFKELFLYRSEFKIQLLNYMTDVWNFLTRLNDKIK
jgi:hypothetical protein